MSWVWCLTDKVVYIYIYLLGRAWGRLPSLVEHQHLWRKTRMTFRLPQLWYYGLSESFLSICEVLVWSQRLAVWQEDFCAKLGQKLLKYLRLQRGFLSRSLEFCSMGYRLRCRLWTDIVWIHIAYREFILLFSKWRRTCWLTNHFHYFGENRGDCDMSVIGDLRWLPSGYCNGNRADSQQIVGIWGLWRATILCRKI